MNIFVEIEFAPEWLKKVVGDAKYVAVIEMFDADATKYPALRDRTEFYRKALSGMEPSLTVNQIDMTGSELHKQHGFDAVGAQFVKKFRIMYV